MTGLPSSTSNFTANVTTQQPIIITYTASDAANQSVIGIRSLTVYDPCGPAEKTCSSVTFACSINGNCGVVAASLTELLLPGSSGSDGSGSGSSSSSATMTGSISVNAAVVAAAAAAATLQFATPDETPPVITILGAGQPYVTTTGSSGLITTVVVGSTYVDDGATAIKVPSNALLPAIDLTASFVTTGAETVITAAPTLQPFIVSYDVRDNAVPPNSAATMHRRVQVVCRGAEVMCNNDDGSLACSYGGICMGVAAASPPLPVTAVLSRQSTSTGAAPPAEVTAVASLPEPTSIVNQGYRRGTAVVRRQRPGVDGLAEILSRANISKSLNFGWQAPVASRSKKVFETAAWAPPRRSPRFVRTPAGFYAPLSYDHLYAPLSYNAIVPVLSLNGPATITVFANQPYAPCMGVTTSNCEMGATATLSTTGDFNGRITACADKLVSACIQQFGMNVKKHSVVCLS